MNALQKSSVKNNSLRASDLNKNRLTAKNTFAGLLTARKEKYIRRTKKRSAMPDMAYEDMLNCCD
ncbi:MAG: hypothetical protein ABJA78_07145 [Ferruginibacter sp.]